VEDFTMWDYSVEQKIFEIGNVKLGGTPGDRPTVLVATIFYDKNSIVNDPFKGDFDKKSAEELINRQETMSDVTGNPCMLDVVGSSVEAIKQYLSFITDITDVPILFDCTSLETKIEGLHYAKEIGIVDKIVYNSLTGESKEEEYQKIQELNLKNALLLAYNIKEFTTEGRIKIVKEVIPKAIRFGIHNILLDLCVLDLPTFGSACKAIFRVKNEIGFPAGAGSHNAIALWKGLKSKVSKAVVKSVTSSCMATTAAVGADFILYGPIEYAEYVFPSVAMVDIAYSQLIIEGGKRVSREHPRFKFI